MSTPRFDGLTFVALFMIFFLGLKVFTGRTEAKTLAQVNITLETGAASGGMDEIPASQGALSLAIPAENAQNDDESGKSSTQKKKKVDDDNEETPSDVIAPYKKYSVTQGTHGSSYGHAAVDLSAGKGAKILSPITGKVSSLFIDEWGNPNLIIENNKFRITLMHGNYSVQRGESLVQGQVVGRESNQGYTMDMYGNLCYGRSGCGYHTHINIYDKKLKRNVNPLQLIGK